jgi:hypothetical protein
MPQRFDRRARTGSAQRYSRLFSVIVASTIGLATVAPNAVAAGPRPDEYWFGNLSISDVWQVTKGQGITVAVVDGGVQADLGDLAGQVVDGYDATLSGANPKTEKGADYNPQYGHGTDMATLIAGTGKGAGFVGIAPGAKIMPINIGYMGRGTAEAVSRGIHWAVDHGARIVSMSVGGRSACPQPVADAARYAYSKGVLVLASSGNDGVGAVEAPANCPGVLAIAAVDSESTPIKMSNYGPQVAFAETGYAPPNVLLNGQVGAGGDPRASGTSPATALAAASLALIWSHFPHESARQIVTRAMYTAHNGLGAKVRAKRANDHIGFGQILPYFGVTVNPPSNTPNPIFDAWDKQFAAQSSSASPSSASAPTAAPSSATSSKAGGSHGAAPIMVGVLALIGIVVLGFALLRRRAGAVDSKQA